MLRRLLPGLRCLTQQSARLPLLVAASEIMVFASFSLSLTDTRSNSCPSTDDRSKCSLSTVKHTAAGLLLNSLHYTGAEELRKLTFRDYQHFRVASSTTAQRHTCMQAPLDAEVKGVGTTPGARRFKRHSTSSVWLHSTMERMHA